MSALAPLLGLTFAIAVPQDSGETRIRDYGLNSYVRVSQPLPHREDKPWKLVCELPYNCHFQPWIELESPAGKPLVFNSTNPLVLYLTPTESCTTREGDNRYEAKNWVSGEGAMYTIPAGATVKAVKYRETGYDTDFVGSFQCSDEDYNILWKRAARTAYLCMRDHFYDCPDRERTGFWGDGTPELDQCFYIFDRRSHAICKDLVLAQVEPTFYPGQHLEFLGRYGLWFYYMQTGDLESLAKVYQQTKTFLLKTYAFGNKGTWFDWGVDSKDTSVIETCFEVIDLKSLKDIAHVTGHDLDIPEIDVRIHALASSFDAKYWRGGYYQSSDVNSPDDRANALAVEAGLASPDKWEAIYQNVLASTTNSSCFFDRWVFEALCRMGKQDKALLRMVNRYRTMIDSDFSSLWEHYDRWWASWLNAFDDASSLNHGWNPPALVLSYDIAGIRPTKPGWREFEVMPKEAFLSQINVSVPTVMGNVPVQIHKTAHQYTLNVVVPNGTQAILGLPKGSFSRLQSVALKNSQDSDDRSAEANAKALQCGDSEGYLRFKVPPGSWTLRGTGDLPTQSPKQPRPQPERVRTLDSRGWTASASVADGSFLFSGAKIPVEVGAANALDGDHWTGWRDMTSLQHPGQWFQIDMKRPQRFNQLKLDNTWALYDYPRGYSVSVSRDGVHWGSPIATGTGHLGITTIRFPMQRAQWLRITQTGSDKTYHWSIYELSVQVRA